MREPIVGKTFVTVGNAKQPFQRLFRAVDDLVAAGIIVGPVVMQVGHSSYQARACEARAFFEPSEFRAEIAAARHIICHAGAGTLMDVLRLGKVPVIMPRQHAYGEHVDDHQVELARAVEAQGRAAVAMTPDEVESAIRRAASLMITPQPRADSAVATIRALLDSIAEKRIWVRS